MKSERIFICKSCDDPCILVCGPDKPLSCPYNPSDQEYPDFLKCKWEELDKLEMVLKRKTWRSEASIKNNEDRIREQTVEEIMKERFNCADELRVQGVEEDD